MTKSKIKNKSRAKMLKIQKVLKKACEGKDTGDIGAEFFIDDAADLISYYKLVSSGKFDLASNKQNDMDTATRDLIDEDVFYFVEQYEQT